MPTRLKSRTIIKCKEKMSIFLKGLPISVIIILITPSNQGCIDKDSGLDIDSLPRFTQHCWGPTWSPDGKTIAFGYVPWIAEGDSFIARWDSSGIFFIDADGKNKRPFLMAGIAPFLCYPDFSPDGRWLAYIGGPGGVNNMYKAKIDGDSIIQLTFNKNYWNRRPRWSPDGKKILFGRCNAPRDSSGLCLMDSDGSDVRVINQNNSAEVGDFLPDYRIVFGGWVNKWGIWLTDTMGLNKYKISDFRVDGVKCSPDGSKILFVIFNEEKNRFEIWVMDIDGTDVKRLCIDGFEPCWSPDMTKIVYVKFNYYKQAMKYPGYGELWIMNADGSNQRQLTYPD